MLIAASSVVFSCLKWTGKWLEEIGERKAKEERTAGVARPVLPLGAMATRRGRTGGHFPAARRHLAVAPDNTGGMRTPSLGRRPGQHWRNAVHAPNKWQMKSFFFRTSLLPITEIISFVLRRPSET
jgi:hypothetical protein